MVKENWSNQNQNQNQEHPNFKQNLINVSLTKDSLPTHDSNMGEVNSKISTYSSSNIQAETNNLFKYYPQSSCLVLTALPQHD